MVILKNHSEVKSPPLGNPLGWHPLPPKPKILLDDGRWGVSFENLPPFQEVIIFLWHLPNLAILSQNSFDDALSIDY